jgi:CRP-like cAMP-binding protein
MLDTDPLARELFVRSTLPGLTGEAAARLAASLRPLSAVAGEVLFEPGQPPERLYLVLEGELALELPGEEPWRFGPRSIVGINDMMIDRPHLRRCVVRADARLLVARTSAWLDLIEDVVVARGALISVGHGQHKLWLELASKLPERQIDPVDLPPPPLPLYEKILILRDAALLRNAGMQATASLAHVAEEVRLDAEQPLFGYAEEKSTLYIVASGSVELEHETESIVSRYGPGSLLGGAAALAAELGVYRARALEPAALLRIRDEDFFDQAEEHPDLNRTALAYLMLEREPLMLLQPPAISQRTPAP